MQITITLKQLQDADACSEAVEIFKAAYGESATEIWTRERQIEVIKGPLGKFVGWAFAKRLLPMWSMSRSNLSGSNLSRSNLSGSNLSGSNLSRSNLSGSDLSGSDLSGSNLSRSDLSRSNLSGSDLSGSDLSRSDLSGSDLSGAVRLTDPPGGWEIENGILKRKESK